MQVAQENTQVPGASDFPEDVQLNPEWIRFLATQSAAPMPGESESQSEPNAERDGLCAGCIHALNRFHGCAWPIDHWQMEGEGSDIFS